MQYDCPSSPSQIKRLLLVDARMKYSTYSQTVALILSSASLLPSLVLAQPEPSSAELTANLVTYSTNQCCGGSIGYTRIPAGRCITSSGHPSVYGASLTVTGFWGDSNIAYGYLTGFRDANCQEKAYEIRYEGCLSIAAANRAGSWSWTRETYEPPHIRQDVNSTAHFELAPGEGPERGQTKGADYFAFYDELERRERRIALDSEQDVEAVLSMYEARDFAGLRGMYECKSHATITLSSA